MGFGTNSYVLVQTAPGDEESKFDVVRVLASTEDIAQKLCVSADYSPTFLGNSQVTSHWHVFSGRRFKRSAVLMETKLEHVGVEWSKTLACQVQGHLAIEIARRLLMRNLNWQWSST